jgi:hypothetical protein
MPWKSMKHAIAFAFVGLLALCGSSHAAERGAFLAYGTFSCGSWTKAAKPSSEREWHEAWLYGFVTGYNWGLNTEDVNTVDTDAITSWMDRYCSAYPLDTIVRAGGRLIDELRAKRQLPPLMNPN